MDAVLNTKGHQNMDNLHHAYQNIWQLGKLVQSKMWEIELLDGESNKLGMTLRDAMMDLRHPTNTNKKCNLLHLIDKHFCKKGHVLTVLKSMESQVHAMIVVICFPIFLGNMLRANWQISRPDTFNNQPYQVEDNHSGSYPMIATVFQDKSK